MLAPELLNILVCPVCKGTLCSDDVRSTLVCPVCALAYPVRGGIPVMLPAEAEPLGGRDKGASGP